MIRVRIDINGKVIEETHAHNVTDKTVFVDEDIKLEYGKGVQLYLQDEKKIVVHKFEEGAIDLAIKMLQDLKDLNHDNHEQEDKIGKRN